MKKISTLFKRDFDEKHNAILYPEFKEEFKHLLEDKYTIPTLKLDGTACAIIDGKFYKRYDAKKGKPAPEGAIPCDNPDPVTGHWPHWIEVLLNDKGSKWHIEAYKNTEGKLEDGTYEAIGPHFQNNPYHLEKDILIKHGIYVLSDLQKLLNFDNDTKLKTLDELAYDVIRCYLLTHRLEGIVFWNKDKPVCKIKSRDYGIKWINKDLSEDLFIKLNK